MEPVPAFEEFESWILALVKREDLLEYEFGHFAASFLGGWENMRKVLSELEAAWAGKIDVGYYEDRGPTYVVQFKAL